MQYVAFMRGVSPSTPPRSNANIVAAMKTMGFDSVVPVLSSGNYIFSTDDVTEDDGVASSIEKVLERELGVRVMTIVRRRDEIQRVIDNYPLINVPHGPSSYQLVTFFKRPVDIGFTLPYQPAGTSFQLVAVIDGALITISDNSPEGRGRTINLMGWLEKQYTKDLTSRTPVTLQRILRNMGA